MTHYISICTENGKKASLSGRITLQEYLANFKELSYPTKEDNFLLYGGFIESDLPYNRHESNLLMKMNVAVIDCDNSKGNPDPNVIDKFREDMKDYDYVLYQTSTSTKECPKFRAIIPLDRTINYDKYTKKAVLQVFDEYSDKAATWFFSVDSNHLDTVEIHDGKLFPSIHITSKANKLMTLSMLEEHQRSKIASTERLYSLDRKKNVSNNAKVRHYLDTSYTKMTGNGDSDSSLYVAICVCVTAGDDETLDDVLSKARMEHWSRQELDRKINQARRFVRKY